jgi:hypothetical protein
VFCQSCQHTKNNPNLKILLSYWSILKREETACALLFINCDNIKKVWVTSWCTKEIFDYKNKINKLHANSFPASIFNSTTTYSIYEVKNCHNAENISAFSIFKKEQFPRKLYAEIRYLRFVKRIQDLWIQDWLLTSDRQDTYLRLNGPIFLDNFIPKWPLCWWREYSGGHICWHELF